MVGGTGFRSLCCTAWKGRATKGSFTSNMASVQHPVLAIHPGALGDVVLLGQFLAALRQRHGAVTLVAGGAQARLLAGLGVVDRAIDIESLALHEAFSDQPASACRLPRQIGPCRLLVSCLATGDGRAQRRLAELTRASESLFLPIRPGQDWPRHLVDLWAEQAHLGREPRQPRTGHELREPRTSHERREQHEPKVGREQHELETASGYEPSVPVPHWPVPQAWRRDARVELDRLGVTGRPMVIHPGAGSPAKCWPLERFVELARRLAPSPPGVVFVVGPAEVDWWGGDRIGRELGSHFPLLIAPPLERLAGLLAEAAVFVGNDSGPSHLAAAVGPPTIALFGPTSPTHFAPRGASVRVVSAPKLSEITVRDAAQWLVSE